VARKSVVVVGAGITGLVAAWELTGAAKGPDASTPRVEIIDAAPKVGGVLATTTFADRVIDLGADGFLARRPEVTTLVDELGLRGELEPIAASGASIFLRGALYPLPTGLVLGVPTSATSLRHFRGLTRRARARARLDRVLPRGLEVGDDVSIGEILRTKLGRELTYHFIEPMIGGIQAGRVDDLSARSVFPALYDAARSGGSLMRALRAAAPVSPGPRPGGEGAVTGPGDTDAPLFCSLTSGVGSLPDTLSRRLRERGVVLRPGIAVTALRRTPAGNYPWEVDTVATTTPADAVILATPAPVVATLLGAHDDALAALAGVTSAGAAMVTFLFSRSDIKLPVEGTGVLIPLGTRGVGDESLLSTAVTLLDRKWPRLERDDEVLLRVHVGRSDDERWSTFSDDELSDRVLQELRFVLGRCGEPTASLVQRWPQGLPQYRPGHEQLVQRAREAASRLGVALAGNAYDGVGIPASVGSGRRAARDVQELLSTERFGYS